MDEIGRGTPPTMVCRWRGRAQKIWRIRLGIDAVCHPLFRADPATGENEGVANVHLDALEHGDTIAFMTACRTARRAKATVWRLLLWRRTERGY